MRYRVLISYLFKYTLIYENINYKVIIADKYKTLIKELNIKASKYEY